jgi:hypothetical protein
VSYLGRERRESGSGAAEKEREKATHCIKLEYYEGFENLLIGLFKMELVFGHYSRESRK